jgi:hypothetical protein
MSPFSFPGEKSAARAQRARRHRSCGGKLRKKDASRRTTMTSLAKEKTWHVADRRNVRCGGGTTVDRHPPPRRWADRPLVRPFFFWRCGFCEPKNPTVVKSRWVPEREKHTIAVQRNHDGDETASNRDSFEMSTGWSL